MTGNTTSPQTLKPPGKRTELSSTNPGSLKFPSGTSGVHWWPAAGWWSQKRVVAAAEVDAACFQPHNSLKEHLTQMSPTN